MVKCYFCNKEINKGYIVDIEEEEQTVYCHIDCLRDEFSVLLIDSNSVYQEKQEYNKLKKEYEDLHRKHLDLTEDYETLKEDYETFKEDYAKLTSISNSINQKPDDEYLGDTTDDERRKNRQLKKHLEFNKERKEANKRSRGRPKKEVNQIL